MARVTGPLFSMSASGSLGGAIVFATNKGRNIVRELVIPSNPKVPLQVSTRAMMRFLTTAWATLSPTEHASWLALAGSQAISSFNAYVQANMRRWTQFQVPLSMPTGAGNVSQVIGAQSAAGGVGIATINQAITTLNDGWPIMLHRSATPGFTPGRSTLVYAAISPASGTSISIVDRPPTPGTWKYVMMHSKKSGTLVATGAELSAVVT